MRGSHCDRFLASARFVVSHVIDVGWYPPYITTCVCVCVVLPCPASLLRLPVPASKQQVAPPPRNSQLTTKGLLIEYKLMDLVQEGIDRNPTWRSFTSS